MAVTASAFRGAFPAYADTTKYPDTQVNFYLALALRVHSADRWGDLLDFGVQLWTAHSLAMDAMGGSAANPGAISGNKTSMSADGLSWSRDISSALDPKQGHWNLTIFGLRWRELVNMIGAGPVYVGAPTLYDAYLSAGGWTGPWPYPGETPGTTLL